MKDTQEVLEQIDQATADHHLSTSPHPQPEPATPETPVPFSPRPQSMEPARTVNQAEAARARGHQRDGEEFEPVPAPHMPDPETPPTG